MIFDPRQIHEEDNENGKYFFFFLLIRALFFLLIRALFLGLSFRFNFEDQNTFSYLFVVTVYFFFEWDGFIAMQ